MIYEVEIDDNNEAGKKALELLKELDIPVQPVNALLIEQRILIEQSLKEIEEGNIVTHENAMKQNSYAIKHSYSRAIIGKGYLSIRGKTTKSNLYPSHP